LSKIQNSDFCKKFEIFFRFFHRSSAKSRRTAKRPTVLNSLLNMLTILITFWKIYFLTNFLNFCSGLGHFFAKNVKNKKFLGLKASGLEIKLRAQQLIFFFECTCILF